MAEKKERWVRVVDFVAESLEAEANGMPPSYESRAKILRDAAKMYRESKNPKMVRITEEK